MAKSIKGEGDPVRLLEVRGDTRLYPWLTRRTDAFPRQSSGRATQKRSPTVSVSGKRDFSAGDKPPKWPLNVETSASLTGPGVRRGPANSGAFHEELGNFR